MDKEKPSKKKSQCGGPKRKTDCKVIWKQNENEISADKPSLKAARICIRNALMLQAWRSQKERSEEFRTNCLNLTAQTKNLRIQIHALHQLLNSEKTKVAVLYEEIQKISGNLEQCKNEKLGILKEKESLECQIQELGNQLTGLENKFKNQKNDLMTAKSEAESWEKQLKKEREKLAKLKEDKKDLVEEA